MKVADIESCGSYIWLVNDFRLREMSVPESEISRLYTILGHPLRRNLIKILGDLEGASFTDLKLTLDVSVGTLYYNLDLLEGLVTQDGSKRYILTSKGEIAYRLLKESE